MTSVTSAATAAAARIGAALSDAQYFESSMVRPEDIRRQLDSRSTKDKLDAMKRVVALISLGKDASMFFPDVVKNVVATSLDVKKLVYLYLVHYAEHKQDLALLAINSFQKDLSDPNQHIRALSLRVLSSIRVKVILQVVILAINNAAKDSSAYVRQAAALAISKVCALDVASIDLLLEPLELLISDRSTHVIGSAVAAFDDVCPYNWEMMHPHYRRICKHLPSVEPWGQVAIIQMLLRYARTHFADPYVNPKTSSTTRNLDLTLLLESVSLLLVSLNHSVVASAIAVFFHLGSADEFCDNAVKPLMRLVSSAGDGGQAVALHIAAAVAIRHPELLIPYISEFFVSLAHPAPIRSLRIKVLMTICASAGRPGGIGSKPEARRMLLSELKEYLFRPDKRLAAASARAIGFFATAHPASTSAIVRVLSSVVASADNPVVVSESIAVLRRLLQRHPSAQAKALPQLIAMLLEEYNSDSTVIRDASARASIIWLIAEFYEKVQPIATEALRQLCKGFSKESSEVKVQILNLAAKVVAWSENSEQALFEPPESDKTVHDNVHKLLLEYVISCARYDQDYDVRDKARMLHAVFLSDSNSQILKAARSAYLSRKPIPSSDNIESNDFPDANLDDDVVIGSMAHVLNGRRLVGFRQLEPWAEEDSNSSLREGESVGSNGGGITRDYIGLSSANFGHTSNSTVTGISWMTSKSNPSNLSSQSVNSSSAMTFSRGNEAGINASRLGQKNVFSRNVNNKKLLNVDPDEFYDEEDDEEDDDDDDDGDDDDDDDDDDEENDDEEDDDDSNKANSFRNAGVSKLIASSSNQLPEKENGQYSKRSDKRKPPTSEYDIDALLGGLKVSTPNPAEDDAAARGTNVLSNDKNLSQWFRVVESWNADGFEIDASFSRGPSPSGVDVTPVVVRVTHRGKEDAKNISLISRCGDCFISQTSIDRLVVNDFKDIKVDCRLRGKTSGVQFAIQVDGKSVGEGEFKPAIGFVVRPRPDISPSEFMSAEKSLTGMFASEATVSMKGPKQNDWMRLSTSIREKILEACFVSHIKTSVGKHGLNSLERFSIVFAGFLPSTTIAIKEQRPILLRLTVNALDMENDGCNCDVWIGCEDVLFSANLLRLCRSILDTIDLELQG